MPKGNKDWSKIKGYPTRTGKKTALFFRSLPVPPTVSSWSVRVPMPVSANDMFTQVGRGRRAWTIAYEAWLLRCYHVLNGLTRRVPGIVEILAEIHGGQGVLETRDSDNFGKPVGDMLQFLKVIENDNLKFVHRTIQEYYPPERPGQTAFCVVRVSPHVPRCQLPTPMPGEVLA